MKKQFIFLMLAVFSCSLHLSAQNKISFDNIRSVYVRNSGTITEGENVKGYYMFYVADKKTRKTNAYTIQILDKNLNKVKEIEFEGEADVQLIESSYCNNSVMFLFLNAKKRKVEYRIYSFDGKPSSSYVKEFDQRNVMFGMYQINDLTEQNQNTSVFGIKDIGYTTVVPTLEGSSRYSYEINFFFADREKQWTYVPEEDDKHKYVVAGYLGSTDSLAVYIVNRRKKLTNMDDLNSLIIGLNIFTGKKQFELSLVDNEQEFLPGNVFAVPGKSELFFTGGYYPVGGGWTKSESLGLAAWRLDNEGKIISKKYLAWDGPLSKFWPIDSRGKMQDIGYMYLHKLLRTQDSKFFAVYEGYKWGAKGMKVTDMVMMEFDDQFNLRDMRIYKKASNSVADPGIGGASVASPGVGGYSIEVAAAMAKMEGKFDYDFTLTNNEHSQFTVGYSDYAKDLFKEEVNKGRIFNTISYSNGKFSTDKISFTSEASWLKIMPGKPGFITIMEYFKKDQKLDMRLEKIN